MKAGTRLGGLFGAQFFGAFNDNALKLLVTLLGFRALHSGAGLDASSVAAAQQSWTTQAFVIFTLPLMLFSLPAAALADRFSKRALLVGTKFLELAIVLAMSIVLFADSSAGTAALILLGAMGLQSALFSPAKYGILPELLPRERLAEGNAQLELWTFVAIVAGTAAGGILLDAFPQQVFVAPLLLAGLSLVGLVLALRIPRVPAAARGSEGFGATISGAWRAIRAERRLWLTVLGQATFWGFASLLSQNLLVWGKSDLGFSDTTSGLPLAVLVVGIGVGSVLAGRLSRGRIELGLIPIGALGLTLSTLAFGLFAPGAFGTFAWMLPIGLASGLLLVPLDALLQDLAPSTRRGAVIALTNVACFGGVLLGSLAAGGLANAGLDTRWIFVVAALAMLAATVWALYLLPIAFCRMIAVLITKTVYRQTVRGRANVPETGPALLVPNHVTFADGLFIAASIDRPIRFVVDAPWFESKLFGWLLRTIRAIPISTTEGPKATLRSLQKAGEALDDGELVCIFAEGQLTRTGAMLPFKRGLERIVKGRDVPVIPTWLGGLWGSVFSYERSRFVWKRPKRIPYPISVDFGAPLPSSTPFAELRRAVADLGTEAAMLEKREAPHAAYLRMARRSPRLELMCDTSGKRLRARRSLAATIALARALRPEWDGCDRVAILLPPSVGGALANLAAAFAGKTSVNLNYTAGPAGIASACRQAEVGRVLTSRAFVEKAKLELPDSVEPFYIEDVAERIGGGAKLWAAMLARLAPCRVVERACGAQRRVDPDDVATVIFSSGSTGEPKGVELLHRNLAANLDQATQVLRLSQRDRLLGVLPFFHSFGYLALWLTAREGIGCAFAPNPLDAATVGKLVEGEHLTLMIGTPTFLQLYARRIEPGQFGSLRMVVAGAEKLRASVADLFEQRFGIRPLEGYGATECSPVIAVNVHDFRAPGLYQQGSKAGSVGQLLPGMSARVVDPDDGHELGVGEAGLLLVRGPNVMKGYLGRPEATAEVLRDGYYATGDIAKLDEAGFVTITDRLSRFSKIGGEMVPHVRVEDALHEAAGVLDRVFAVTAIPDDKKGERLVVVHCWDADRVAELPEALVEAGLPNLFVPRADDFVAVDALPLLGSGKLDLRALREIASEKLGKVTASG